MRNPTNSNSGCILLTGGCGFIGSAVVRHLMQETRHTVVNVDALTYAGHKANVAPVADNPRYHVAKVDVTDREALDALFAQHRPDAVMHLAAESHVDRSIEGPAAFIQTNVVGTYMLLEAALHYWRALPEARQDAFRFLHVSTDEVYGELGHTRYFTEETPYDPRSPYSATKASSDHLVRAWNHTYGLPTLITNCSNNYGPYQYPEKLIPVVILKALQQEPIPVYGRGENVRDWLYVADHARALLEVLWRGQVGETYNIGGHNEQKNIDVVTMLCTLLDELQPHTDGKPYSDQITFVTDRPGHDFRYAIDASKIESTLGWTPQETFASGLRKTVAWYLANLAWCEEVTANTYNLERLGVQM